MANTPNLNLSELIYDNTKTNKNFFENEIIGKINSNNTKIDTAITEKITQVALKASLPPTPTSTNNLYIVYGDTNDNNGQYRWNGIAYEKISTQLNYATKVEAEAGADNTKVMTPLRVREFFNANGGGSGGITNVVFKSGHSLFTFTATADDTNTIVIPNESFNPTNDVIELVFDDDNQPLLLDKDYTLVGNTINIISNAERETSLRIGQKLFFYITNTSYEYSKLSGLPDLSNVVRYGEGEIGTPVSMNADTLGGQLPTYYAKSSDVSTINTILGEKADKIIGDEFTGDIFKITGDSYKTYIIKYLSNVTNAPKKFINDWCMLEYIPISGGKRFKITPYTADYNGYTHEAFVSSDGNTVFEPWKLISADFIANDLIKLTTNKTLYVATTGNDTTGDGTSAKPYATIQKAIDNIPKNLGGNYVTINVSQGTYNGFNLYGFYNGSVDIIGSSSIDNVANFNINTYSVISYCNLKRLEIKGFNFTHTGGTGINITNTDCITLYLCKLISNDTTNTGIYISGASNATLHSCTIQNKLTGIQVEEMSSVAIHASIVDNCIKGIRLATSSGLACWLTTNSSIIQGTSNSIEYSYGSVIIENGIPISVSQQLEHKADIYKSYEFLGFFDLTNKTLSSKILELLLQGYKTMTFLITTGTDTENMFGFIRVTSDISQTGGVYVELQNTGNTLVYYRWLNSNTGWVNAKWQQIATTDKVDISSNVLNGWVIYSSAYPLQLSRNGNVVTITGIIKNGVMTDGTVLFTVPAEVKPSKTQQGIAVQGDSTTRLISILTGGGVKIQNGNFTSNAEISINFSYII